MSRTKAQRAQAKKKKLCDEYGEPLEPYFSDGFWRLPYLMDGAGGWGGGIGEMKHETQEGVINMWVEYHTY